VRKLNQYQVQSPVAFIIFNRPECTREVFARIAEAKPRKLLIVADGPRDGVPGEDRRCLEARRVVEHIDWKCDLATNFSDSNLGCRVRVASGLDWIFEQEERAIILEDDCVPAPAFFAFCDELLERYRDEPRVMTICGTNHLRETRADSSYLFTTHLSIWGWATWRRAFATYDVDLKSWSEKSRGRPFDHLPLHKEEIRRLYRSLNNLSDPDPANRKADTWDYQWIYNCYINGGLAVTPRVNLVSNIGFGEDATHTRVKEHKLSRIPLSDLPFPLRHPRSIEVSADYDRSYYRALIRKPFSQKVTNFFRRTARHFKSSQHKVARA
jgi:hypothetical protein